MTARVAFAVLARGALLDEETNTYNVAGAGLRAMAVSAFPAEVALAAVVALEATSDTTALALEVTVEPEHGEILARFELELEAEAPPRHLPGLRWDVRPEPVPLRFTVPGPESLSVAIRIDGEVHARLPLVVLGG